ncbi:DUF222 domain-containing protein [Georgenia sp. Z1491]|uniref:DUF222 domain-containing protein n=1 Tax=Georgenia sp. Z1491 TaxID=3416707 RepID=UPI003CF111FD
MAEDVSVDQEWSALEELLSAQIEAWLATKATQNDAASETDPDSDVAGAGEVSDAVGCDADAGADADDADADAEDVAGTDAAVEDVNDETRGCAVTDSDDDGADLDEDGADLDEEEHDLPAAPTLIHADAVERGVVGHVREPVSSVGVVGGVREIVAQLDELSQARVGDLSGQEAIEVLESIEAAERRLTALRAAATAKVEADGVWALEGQRSFRTWLRDRTGTSVAVAGRQARQARALRDDLALAHGALSAGRISVEGSAEGFVDFGVRPPARRPGGGRVRIQPE